MVNDRAASVRIAQCIHLITRVTQLGAEATSMQKYQPLADMKFHSAKGEKASEIA